MSDQEDQPARGERFRSSREAYDWIMWDGGFEPSEFVIGYDSRDEHMAEIPLELFVPDGEIPWHRVWFIAHGDHVVWDREAKVDRLAEVKGRRLPRRPRVRRVAPGSSYVCPHCAEPADTAPDPGGGADQEYVEDCPVCCRPNRVRARWVEAAGGFEVEVRADE